MDHYRSEGKVVCPPLLPASRAPSMQPSTTHAPSSGQAALGLGGVVRHVALRRRDPPQHTAPPGDGRHWATVAGSTWLGSDGVAQNTLVSDTAARRPRLRRLYCLHSTRTIPKAQGGVGPGRNVREMHRGRRGMLGYPRHAPDPRNMNPAAWLPCSAVRRGS